MQPEFDFLHLKNEYEEDEPFDLIGESVEKLQEDNQPPHIFADHFITVIDVPESIQEGPGKEADDVGNENRTHSLSDLHLDFIENEREEAEKES